MQSIKLTLFFILITFSAFLAQAQDKAELNLLKGFYALNLGTPIAEVEDLLNKKQERSYFDLKMEEGEMEWGKQDAKENGYKFEKEGYITPIEYQEQVYTVRLNNEYETLYNLSIEKLEVFSNDEKDIEKLLFFFKKTKKNVSALGLKLVEELGETFCSSGVNGPPELYCIWEQDGIEVKAYDWDGVGESSYDEFLWLEIRYPK